MAYQSELSNFLNQLKKEDESLEARQQEGRALLWDKPPIDLDLRARQNACKLPQKAYVYGFETTKTPEKSKKPEVPEKNNI